MCDSSGKLDAMDNILLLLGNLVSSHIIAPDSLLLMCVYQTDTYCTHTHTASRCSPPVILSKFWPAHKVIAGERGGGKNSEKKAHGTDGGAGGTGLKSEACLCLVCGFVFVCKQSCCCEYVSVSLSH